MSRNPTERFPGGPTVTELGTKVTGSGQAGRARVSTPDHAKGQPQPDTGPRSASKIARFATHTQRTREDSFSPQNAAPDWNAQVETTFAPQLTSAGRSFSLVAIGR